VLALVMHSADFFSLRNDHQVFDAEDVEDAQEALDLNDPVRVFSDHHVYYE
jgi:hypothetical protein